MTAATRWHRRPWRVVLVALGGWLGVFLAVNLVILVSGVVARRTGHDPREHGHEWPSIRHLRVVGERLLVGGQTTLDEYRGLADRGVTLVIDVRSGDATDQREDDPDALAELGLDYVALPIPDGRAPTPAQVRHFVDLVDGADGLVFAHCGGGVGRSTSLAAAYEAALGQDPSVLEQLATGPPSIEQIWFVGTLRPDHPAHGISPAVAVVSRLVDAPRTAYGWITAPF